MADETTDSTSSPAPETTTSPVPPSPASPPSSAWYDALPDGLKGEKTLHRFKDTGALAQSYLELKRWQDGAIKIPGPDAKPEDVAAYREKLGVPKSPSDYTLEVPKDAPPGTAIDPERFKHYAPAFHKLGLTQAQVQGIAEWAMTEQQHGQRQQAETYAQQLDTLANEWGESVFNKRAAEVQGLVRKYADPETVAWLDASGLTNHPGLFKMLYPIARQFAEDGLIEPTGDSPASDLSSLDTRISSARDEILKLTEGTPQYRAKLDEYEQLWKLRAEVLGQR